MIDNSHPGDCTFSFFSLLCHSRLSLWIRETFKMCSAWGPQDRNWDPQKVLSAFSLGDFTVPAWEREHEQERLGFLHRRPASESGRIPAFGESRLWAQLQRHIHIALHSNLPKRIEPLIFNEGALILMCGSTGGSELWGKSEHTGSWVGVESLKTLLFSCLALIFNS